MEARDYEKIMLLTSLYQAVSGQLHVLPGRDDAAGDGGPAGSALSRAEEDASREHFDIPKLLKQRIVEVRLIWYSVSGTDIWPRHAWLRCLLHWQYMRYCMHDLLFIMLPLTYHGQAGIASSSCSSHGKSASSMLCIS